ncbi:MAG: hypothetical protein U5K33_05470 [Halofilum sp. (in: g-proteobacteria)]|nr:hypothetical protein [Halofilum sp. (in: g-proteobacteria)]
MKPHATLLALASLLTTACTHTVVAPADPARPVSTFLLDHGRHATVVIEQEDGLTRYSYGHWSYYAELQMGPTRASGAIIGSDQAGLGRRQMSGAPGIYNIRRQIPVVTEAAWRIEVGADAANRLVDRLDSIFREQHATRIENRLYDLEFVHHPDAYRLGHNSNHVAGEWLRALGCEVEMHGPLSSWQVKNAAEHWPRNQP